MDRTTIRFVVAILGALGAYALHQGQTADFSICVVAIAGLLPGAKVTSPPTI